MTSPEDRAKEATGKWAEAAKAAIESAHAEAKVPEMEDFIASAIRDAEEAEREAIIENINARIVALQELLNTHYTNANAGAVMSTQSTLNACIGTIDAIRARSTQ